PDEDHERSHRGDHAQGVDVEFQVHVRAPYFSARPRDCRYATSASCSVLPLSSSGALAISSSVYGTPTMRSAFMWVEIVAASAAFFSSHAYAGMLDSGTKSRGLFRWMRCHSSLYLPPTRCRSGPVRLEPHWNGWSQTNSPATE